MKRFMWLIPVFIAALLGVTVLSGGGMVFAATSQNVTINATPAYISISNAPSTWILNGITGGGFVDVDTVYYSNPLGDTSAPSATVNDSVCRFTLTNDSTIAIDITFLVDDFLDGDCDMTNSDDGSNAATTFGAYSWFSGDAYANKTVIKQVASAVGIDALGTGVSPLWGAEIETRTDPWTGGTASHSNMTVTATAN